MAKTKQAPYGRTVQLDGQDFVFNPTPAPLFLKADEKALWSQTSVALQIAQARQATAIKYGQSGAAYQAEIDNCEHLLAQLSA